MNAVIPRWPNGYIEPLQAVYRTDKALKASEEAVENGRMDMRSMIRGLRRVRYVSTIVIREIDPELDTFMNINSRFDLRRAELILKRRGRAREREAFSSSI